MSAAAVIATTVTATSVATGTPSSVIISNVMYVVGAVVLATVMVAIIVLRHRRPTSVQSNVDTFHRGLAALAPGAPPGRRRAGPTRVDVGVADSRPTAVGAVSPRAGGSAPPRPTRGVGPG